MHTHSSLLADVLIARAPVTKRATAIVSAVIALFAAPIAAIADPAPTATLAATTNSSGNIAQDIADALAKLAGDNHGARLLHAKGAVCHGFFMPAKSAAGLTSAFGQPGKPVPILVRLSDGAGMPDVPDGSPVAVPRGMAIRFTQDGVDWDIVASSRNGFQAATGQELLDFLQAALSSPPSAPHPTPFEKFLGSHPNSAKVLMAPIPSVPSFAGVTFYGNDSFKFTNAAGDSAFGRYLITPIEDIKPSTPKQVAKWAPDILFDDLKKRLHDDGKRGHSHSIDYVLKVQVADPGDAINNSSIPWPASRKTVDVGTIVLLQVDPDSDTVQKQLAFDPMNLPKQGIAASDDPLLPLRSQVYAISAARRH